MSITDELREYFGKSKGMFTDHVLAIADRIDAEHERAMAAAALIAGVPMTDENMAEHGWIRLPVDADGEYIHIGDRMERGGARGRVIALMLSNYPKKWGGKLHWGIQLEGERAPTALDNLFHHYHAPTVEDVLREFAEKITDSQIPGVHPTYEEAIAEYAQRLQLREVDE